MKKLLIVGAGSHGQAVAETAMACGYSVVDFLDDRSPRAIGGLDAIEQLEPFYDAVIVSLGNNALREELLKRIRKPATLIHPRAYVAPSAVVGEGSVMLPGALVHTNARIGKGCILSVGVCIDHDAAVGDFCHVNTGAVIGAGKRVAPRTRVEAGAVL